MASYNELNALIDAYINRNGVQAITGQILNGVLKAMVEQLGRGYTIMGAAIPTTDPGTPDGPECYFASETGTYTDFDGLQVAPGELALLCYTPTDGWTKATIYEGFQEVGATIDGNVGTPSVGVSYANGVLSFDFHNMKGNPGDAAGFGTIGADITGGVGTPGVTVESSGPATAKNLQFHFTNLKGETGVTSVVATVDNTTGTPACTVSLVGQQLTLAFSGLKGAQGDTGSSVDYPFTIVNNLTTDDATQALSAAQGVVLDCKVTQLEAEVTDFETATSREIGKDETPELNLESGGIMTSDGTNYANVSRIRTSGYIVANGIRVTTSGNKTYICGYKNDGTYVGWRGPITSDSDVYIDGVDKYRLTFGKADDAHITPSDFDSLGISIEALFIGSVVSVSANQHLTEEQKKNATDNIGATPLVDDGKYFLRKMSLWASDIYTSTTGNFLDTKRVVKGFYISNGNGTIVVDARGICSGFIYVGDIAGNGSVTVSGYVHATDPNRLYLSFVSDAAYTGKHISTYTFTGTKRTISVPSNAKYVFVCLAAPGVTLAGSYENIKLSKTATETTDAFNGKYLGSAFHPEVWNKTIATTESVEQALSGVLQMKDFMEVSETDQMLDYTKRQIGVRVTDVSPYIKTDVSVAVSSPYIPVLGATKIKLSNLPSWVGITFSRYLAFTTDRSGTAASVIVSSIRSVSNNLEVTVPATAKYLIFVMGSNTANTEADMAKIKVSRSGGFTYDEYKGKKLLYTYTEYESGAPYYSEDPLAENRDWLPGETARVQKEFLPYSVGSPSESVSMSGQYNRVNILMFTDSHIDLGANNGKSSVQNVEDTIAFAKKSGVFDAIINAGDIITPFGVNTKESQKTKAASFFNPCKTSAIPVIFSVGNHDTNDWFNTAENAFNDADWGDMWLDWAEQNYGIVRQIKQSGDKSTWHYYDIASKKIRIICLDVQDADKELTNESGKVIFYGGVAFYISNEQFNWMANTALNFDDKAEKDWGVVIVSHQGTEYGVGVRNANNGDALANWVGGTAYVVGNLVKYNDAPYRCNTANSDATFDSAKWDNLSVERDINKFSAMLKAFNEQSTYSAEYTCEGDSFYNLSVNADWTRYANLEKKPFVVCWVLGHEHLDKNEVVNGIQMIWTLNGSCTASSSDARVARIAETPLQNAFDCISIDTKTRKIRYVRFGAGRNCYGVGGDRFLPDGLSF